jgi:predicted RNase H-like HicB family nuclease
MTTREHVTVVLLHEENGTVSAYLPDLPGVYAAAGTLSGAQRGIREALLGFLDAMPRGQGVGQRPNQTLARRPVEGE